jgi:SAM-dependent methyltransferase
MQYERITKDSCFDGYIRDSHESRYYLASGFVEPRDKIVDFGCGDGYAEDIILKGRRDVSYFGIDKNPPNKPNYRKIDFNFPINLDIKDFDISVCFECLEHIKIDDFLIKEIKKAKKWIILSVPVIPTKHTNKYHVRDFDPRDVITTFSDDTWNFYDGYRQNEIYGIFIFKNKNYGQKNCSKKS